MLDMVIDKPVCFFDLETTGTDVVKDRIVSIYCKIFVPPNIQLPGGKEFVRETLINPGIPIPKEASDVHGITDEMVKMSPRFAEMAPLFYDVMHPCDLAGYNIISFDIPMIAEEFARCSLEFPKAGTRFIDSFRIFKLKEKRDLSAALKFYCGREHDSAHTAGGDVNATIDIFNGQLSKYNDLNPDVNEIFDFCMEGKKMVDFAGKLTLNENGEIVYAFGKHINKRVTDERSYAQWMLQSDFPSQTKNILAKILSQK